MALMDISLVTKTVKNLISKAVHASPEWPIDNKLKVTGQPPDKLSGNYTIGCYLYHISEDEHIRNAVDPSNPSVPLRYTPMGVNLYYQLTALSEISTGTSDDAPVLAEQRMLGMAIKAIRDYPTITDKTVVDGTDPDDPGNLVMDELLRGAANALRLEILPIEHTQSVSFWTPNKDPLRLSAYLRVSAVMLESADAPSRAQRVLSYGAHVFASNLPRLETCSNSLTFQLGETEETVSLQPAQAPAGGGSEDDRTITVKGSGFAGEVAVFIDHKEWANPEEIPAAWSPKVGSDHLSFVAQSSINGRNLLPGWYTVHVRKQVIRTLSNGVSKTFSQTSNSLPFALAPVISPVEKLSPTDANEVMDAGCAAVGVVDDDSIQVFVADMMLERKTASGGPGKGEYKLRKAPHEIRFRLPKEMQETWLSIPQKQLPLRVIVNGVESLPTWILAEE